MSFKRVLFLLVQNKASLVEIDENPNAAIILQVLWVILAWTHS